MDRFSPGARRRGYRGNGGAGRDRTDDLKLAKLALSQLSYGPDPLADKNGTPTENGGPRKT